MTIHGEDRAAIKTHIEVYELIRHRFDGADYETQLSIVAGLSGALAQIMWAGRRPGTSVKEMRRAVGLMVEKHFDALRASEFGA